MTTSIKKPSQRWIANNELIRIPEKLITDDGRVLYITGWHPSVCMDHVATVVVVAKIIRDANVVKDNP